MSVTRRHFLHLVAVGIGCAALLSACSSAPAPAAAAPTAAPQVSRPPPATGSAGRASPPPASRAAASPAAWPRPRLARGVTRPPSPAAAAAPGRPGRLRQPSPTSGLSTSSWRTAPSRPASIRPRHRPVPVRAQPDLRRADRLEREDGASSRPWRPPGRSRRTARPGPSSCARASSSTTARRSPRRRSRPASSTSWTRRRARRGGPATRSSRGGPPDDGTVRITPIRPPGPAVPDGGRLDPDHQPGRPPEVRQGSRAQSRRDRAVQVRRVDAESARGRRGESRLLGPEAGRPALGLPADPGGRLAASSR